MSAANSTLISSEGVAASTHDGKKLTGVPKGPKLRMMSLTEALTANLGTGQGLIQGTIKDDEDELFKSYLFAVVGKHAEAEASSADTVFSQSTGDEADTGSTKPRTPTTLDEYTADRDRHHGAITTLRNINSRYKKSVEGQDVQPELAKRMKALSEGTSQLTYLYNDEKGASDDMDANQYHELVGASNSFTELGAGEVKSVWLIKVATEAFNLDQHLAEAEKNLQGLSLQETVEQEPLGDTKSEAEA